MSEITRRKLQSALLFIEENLNKRLTAAQVSEHANLSSFHFQRLFCAYLGESLSQYVLHRRLERSAQRLISDFESSIIDIALDSGFETHSAFSRAFKKHFDISPSHFRQTPNLAKLGGDNSRPLLKTTPAKNSPLKVHIQTLPELFFNYKTDKGTHDGTFFRESRSNLGKDFSYLVTTQDLFGLISAFPSSPQSLNDKSVDILYGGLYPRIAQNKWSENWLNISSGLWAVCEHRGSYDYLYQTWNMVLRSWLATSDYELRDTLPFEQYLTSPADSPEKDWLTKIYIPINTARSEQIR
ncbi:hypothetical protein VIBNISOn1_1750010 [Vibrio nigripulchritudo SOn1]|uniref:HTH araC/xylS-type domain-containing protein n=1 Tax=Vibrio nigripulchritudo SOn1 TaxID=1238450 RepID=A0AAV2VPE5_9VIBR|nr:AraC family transcriptional regulator [Vibrio nigripulchritudo]CCO46338.1 hypothetical protein VIBNISOn1_1750010 [Vibrio nigripulchritudo SOn1]